MAQILVSKAVNLIFNKTDIAIMLGTNYHTLNRFLSEDIKKAVGWQNGRAYYNDAHVDMILKHFRPLLTAEQRFKIIYPNGI
jgi:hypothetical protein